MKQKRTLKVRILSLLLAMVMIVAAGCGKGEAAPSEGGGGTGSSAKEDGGAAEGSSDDGDAAMGRYVEETIDISQICMNPVTVQRLNDGRLAIGDMVSGVLMSSDNGQTWSVENPDWLSELIERNMYFMDMKIAADGSIGVVCDDQEGILAETGTSEGAEASRGTEEMTEETAAEAAEGESEGTGEAAAEGTEAEGAEEAAAEAENEEEASEAEAAAQTGEDYEIQSVCVIYRPDGTVIRPEIPLTEEDIWVKDLWFAPDGRMFASTLGRNIYEINEDGTAKLFLTAETRPELISFVGNKMLVDGYDYANGILIYDMESGQYAEDQVLRDFVQENHGDRDYYGGGWYDLYFFPGEEDEVIYLVSKLGLYRHVIGGSAMEQVIDGKLSGLNNPANGIKGMTALDNNEFLVLFANATLLHFTYDPNIPTVPGEILTVYSLKENSALRQAVSLYQAAHPEVFVSYELGMEGDSVTREDALKKLNTEMMAGEGPDVLLLDEMPMDSYMEKGMLADLSGFLEGLTGEEALFENIARIFETEKGVFAVPSEMQIPVILGKKEYTDRLHNLEDIAKLTAQIRRENPGRDIWQLYSEKGIMNKFAMVSAPYWIKEDGSLDREEIGSFLEQCRLIFEEQMNGIDQQIVDRYHQNNAMMVQEYGEALDDLRFARSASELEYLGGNGLICAGTLTSAYEYAMRTSVQKVEGFTDNELIPMVREKGTVFLPKTIAGISASSDKQKQAEDFLKVLLGKENQTTLYEGFAVNKAAFDESFVPNEEYLSEDGMYGYVSSSSPDGFYVEMAVYWPAEDQINDLKDMIQNADTPYVYDSVLENAVIEQGIGYLQGSQSLEEALDAIEEKASIYLAE